MRITLVTVNRSKQISCALKRRVMALGEWDCLTHCFLRYLLLNLAATKFRVDDANFFSCDSLLSSGAGCKGTGTVQAGWVAALAPFGSSDVSRRREASTQAVNPKEATAQRFK